MTVLLHLSDTHFGTEQPQVVAALERCAPHTVAAVAKPEQSAAGEPLMDWEVLARLQADGCVAAHLHL